MDFEDIYPKIKIEDDEKNDYEIEISEKKSFFKKNKLLPSGDEKNFKETIFSIETIWKYNELKNNIINKIDILASFFYKRHRLKTSQENIEIQTIQKNNIVKNISVASKKIGIISPIIPKKTRSTDEE